MLPPRSLVSPLLWLLAALPIAAQGGKAGRVLLTLSDVAGTPVAGETVAFLTERGEPLATCATDTAGRCTLVLLAAPTDAGGFIRGRLQSQQGHRPLLWPGGDLFLTLTPDAAGRLDPPADVYVVHDPVATLVAEASRPAPSPSSLLASSTPPPDALVPPLTPSTLASATPSLDAPALAADPLPALALVTAAARGGAWAQRGAAGIGLLVGLALIVVALLRQRGQP